jgi:hypothetical protein
LARADGLPADDAELHEFDFDAHQVEVDLAQDAVLEVELGVGELKLDVQTLLDADLHLDRRVRSRLLTRVLNNELLLLCYSVVVAIDHHVQIVPYLDYYAVVAFELLFHSVELKVIRHIICQTAWGFQIPN